MTENTPSFNRSLFIDSSNLAEIHKWNDHGVIDGVTTNPGIIQKDGVPADKIDAILTEICKTVFPRPVSLELPESTQPIEEMIEKAKKFRSLSENVVVKVPMISECTKGLTVIARLRESKIPVNVTCMMSFEQMVMAALATRECQRPSFISLFWARSIENYKELLDANQSKDIKEQEPISEINSDPRNIVRKIADFLEKGGYQNPRIIVGSIRNKAMVADAFASGAHIVTVTPPVLEAMLYAPRTVSTIEEFDDAWRQLQNRT